MLQSQTPLVALSSCTPVAKGACNIQVEVPQCQLYYCLIAMLFAAFTYSNTVALIRTDVDQEELPQISLGTAERKLLANLTLHSDMLECTLNFLYKSNHGGGLQFLDSLPAQFRLVLHRPTVNPQQVPLLFS